MSASRFYEGASSKSAARESESSDEGEGEIVQRKKAWAELEREQEEVKRNIKSILKTQPESRMLGDNEVGMIGERVKVKPMTYDE